MNTTCFTRSKAFWLSLMCFSAAPLSAGGSMFSSGTLGFCFIFRFLVGYGGTFTQCR